VNNYQSEVKIFKDFHKNIIGKGGATIKKIRDETNTRIDMPNVMNDSDSIKVTGKRADVEKAVAMIEQIQKELVGAFLFPCGISPWLYPFDSRC